MIKDYRILVLLSLFGLIFFGVSLKNASDQEYIKHQKDYYKALDEEFPGAVIQQVNVKTPAGMIVDRCQSCHIGASNPDAAGLEMPLAAHPPIVPGAEKDPHDFNKIGCAVCHDGSSRDLDMHLAHGEAHGWIKPLLPGKLAQASCNRCHAMEGGQLAGAELYEHGRELFLEKACWGCHTISGISTSSQAPELTDAGGKFSYEYLHESIVEPKANDKNSKMPYFDWRHDEETVEALAVYLKGQQKDRLRSEESTPIGYIKPETEEARITEPSVEAGRALFAGVRYEGSIAKGGCINCHGFRNSDGDLSGGNIGPELTWTISNRGTEYVREHIVNSRAHAPDSIMPTFKDYNDAELDSLVAYLSSFDYTLPKTSGGKAIYDTYCLSCHGENFDGKGPLAALLDPLPRAFKYQFTASYEERFKDSILNGIAGTAMPTWKNTLSDEEIDTVIEYIKQNTLGDVNYVRLDAELPKVGDPERMDPKDKGRLIEPGNPERGAEYFQKYCTSCHGKLANGKGPNAYNLVHPLPRNLINKEFLNQESVTDERLYQSILLGVAGTAMPAHDFLKDQSILDLIAFIRSNSKETK